jgi:hypothetical protein
LILRPVSVVWSAVVKKSFGNGRRHAAVSMGSQETAVVTGAIGAAVTVASGSAAPRIARPAASATER